MFNIQDVRLVRPRFTNLWILTFLIILSGMDVTVAAERFNYADNIGFIKDAAKLRDEFPICDEFLDVEWFHQIHRRSSDTWIGKSRLDVYDGDRKDSKAIMATMRCKGEKCTQATVHVIELEQYFDKKLEEWIRKTDWIRRTYCFDPSECDDTRPVSLGILINTNSDDKDYSNDRELFLSVIAGKTNLWDSYFERRIEPLRGVSGIEPLRGDSGRAVLWISTTLIGAVPWQKGNRFAAKSYGLYPNGYPRLSIGHFRKNICILSPAGNEVGIVEPLLPFLSRIFMPDAELKREFGVIYTALSETYPEEFPKDDPGRSDVDEMRGFLRRYVLLDVDGVNGPDLVKRFYFFINDPDPLVMRTDEYMRPEKYLTKSMVSSAEIKSLRKTILQEKERFKQQLRNTKQKDAK